MLRLVSLTLFMVSIAVNAQQAPRLQYSEVGRTAGITAPSDPRTGGVIRGADSDNDGVDDLSDTDPSNPNICRDVDQDTCDDCTNTGANGSGGAPSFDGPDLDGDGFCDAGDTDDDNDGVDDGEDQAPTNPFICRDADSDMCDDCTNTGPNLSGGATDFDGPDFDSDGQCDLTDTDDDNDGVVDMPDSEPFNPFICRDLDMDACDDCSWTGPNFSGGDISFDGPDTDGDGLCDAGDPDDDNDGVIDGQDLLPTDPNVCRDVDNDSCDDCAVTGADGSGGDPANDGPDTDGDGICDAFVDTVFADGFETTGSKRALQIRFLDRN